MFCEYFYIDIYDINYAHNLDSDTMLFFYQGLQYTRAVRKLLRQLKLKHGRDTNLTPT